MNKKIKDNKKLSLLLGIITFLILIIGSTYSYFAVVTSSSYSMRSVSAEAENLGSVSLSNSSNSLSINLSVANFAKQVNDSIYYASASGITLTPTIENVGLISAVGNGNFDCTYDVTVTKIATNDLYNAFQNMSTKSTEQIVLTIDGTKYDFNTPNLFTNFVHHGKVEGVSEGYPKYVTASLYIVDKSDTLQNDLSGKDITINLAISNFKCSAVGIGGKRILANNALKTNLSVSKTNDLLGTNTLYRYQGTYTNVTNNYICFNTYDKDLCVSNPDTYMYRILGIAEDGTIKVIKHAALSGARQWHTASDSASSCPTGTSCDWVHSALYSSINGTGYLSTLNTGWSDKIQNVNWKYGDTTSNQGYSAGDSFTTENSFGSQVNAKIGLMYMYDYYYANGWNGSQSPQYDTNGWIHITHGGSHPNNYEWLLLRYGLRSSGDYSAWRVHSDGYVDSSRLGGTDSVRPVFYLESNVNLLGSGTISDPYTIS